MTLLIRVYNNRYAIRIVVISDVIFLTVLSDICIIIISRVIISKVIISIVVVSCLVSGLMEDNQWETEC